MSSPAHTSSHRTRGKSRPGRLRLLDTYLLARERDLLTRSDGLFASAVVVDLGIGAVAWTTLDLVRALASFVPSPSVVAVEIDPVRVESARGLMGNTAEVRCGGFDLPVAEPVRLIRAMNVLRQYKPDEIPAALARLGSFLLPGGLLVWGSTCRRGTTAMAFLGRRQDDMLVREGLLMACDFSTGFAPGIFLRRPVPAELRGRLVPGHPVRAFIDSWSEAFEEVRGSHRDPEKLFVSSVTRLASKEPMDWTVDLVSPGICVLRGLGFYPSLQSYLALPVLPPALPPALPSDPSDPSDPSASALVIPPKIAED